MALINLVMGTLIAWVLVRDNFPGKRILDVLIDLPFALPTIVAGLVLLSLYGPNSPLGVDIAYKQTGVVVALLFVTLPFVVRTVQPVLLELDQEMEEGAASLGAGRLTIFRRIILPNLLPGDPVRHRARLHPGHQRVRRDRADLRQHHRQDAGRLGADLRLRSRATTRPAPRRFRPCCWWWRWSCCWLSISSSTGRPAVVSDSLPSVVAAPERPGRAAAASAARLPRPERRAIRPSPAGRCA